MSNQTHTQKNLAWCLQSPGLIRIKGDDCWPTDDWFSQLAPQDNMAELVIAPMKLGKLFEHYWTHWIDHEPGVERIATNLVVSDAKRTIGEFDLIVRNHGLIEHWEVAIKFYLATGDSTDLDNWYGPNPVDTLGTKLRRMTDHQLRLSTFPASQTLLADKNWSIDAIKGIVKGRLFYPYENYVADDFTFPDAVNPDHPKGWWLPIEEFTLEHRLVNSRFLVLEKPSWMAIIDATHTSNNPIMNHREMTDFISQRDSGTTHVAQLDENGIEQSRGFVVLNRWMQDVAASSQRAVPQS
jgi:hypothetical protein